MIQIKRHSKHTPIMPSFIKPASVMCFTYRWCVFINW